MPTSVNGIGTEIVQASKVRKLDGEVKYDAVEAFMVLGLILFPYKALHVISEVAAGGGFQYQSIPLKMRREILSLAFLRSWGTMLLLFGAGVSAILGFTFSTMDRPVKEDDRIFLASFLVAGVVGLLLKLVHHFASREHEWIKDTIGPTELGFADPFFLEDEMAKELLADIERQEGRDALLVAREEIGRGNAGKALFMVRLCQNVATRGPTQDLYNEIRGPRRDSS